MKQYNLLKKALILLFASLVTIGTNIRAQETKKNKKEQKFEETRDLIQSKNYVFVAQFALPATGRSINLTSLYDLRLSNDTIVSELPFYGRAYQATLDPSQAGFRFTSTKFDYNIKERKKGGWDITLLPKDTRDVRQMFLTVLEDGNASLSVLSNNRQSMNFTGYITARNKIR